MEKPYTPRQLEEIAESKRLQNNDYFQKRLDETHAQFYDDDKGLDVAGFLSKVSSLIELSHIDVEKEIATRRSLPFQAAGWQE